MSTRVYKTMILALAITTQFLFAQVGLKKVAQSTMNFQLVGISPRASALGEAFCALGTGAESIFYNPAGIATLSSGKFEFQAYSTNWICDIDYFGAALVWNTERYGAIGVSMLNVDYGTIYGTSLITADEKELYPMGYKDLGKVKNVGAYSLGITYSKAISSQFSIGGNLRLAGQNLGQSQLADGLKNNNASKLVLDGGVRYNTGLKGLVFGMYIRNFSSNVKREEIEEQLPTLFAMGIGLDLIDALFPGLSKSHALNFGVDYLHPNNYTERMNIGFEYRLWDKLALRYGYQTNRDLASWSIGFGLNTGLGNNKISFDYSYSHFDIFNGVNRFSLGVAF